MEDLDRTVKVDETVVDESVEMSGDAETTSAQPVETVEVSANYIKPSKKLDMIQKPVLIAIAIFLSAIVAMGAYFLLTRKEPFNDSIVGTWTYRTTASEDEAIKKNGYTLNIFNFTDEKNDNGEYIMEYYYGNMKLTGIWYYLDDEMSLSDEKTDNIYFFLSTDFQGSYKYTVEDGADERVVTLEYLSSYNQNSKPIVLVSTDIPTYEVKPEKDFKPVDGITGHWRGEMIKTDDITGEEKTSVVLFYLNEDGTCEYDLNGETYVNGIYKVEQEKESSDKKSSETKTNDKKDKKTNNKKNKNKKTDDGTEKGKIHISYYLDNSKTMTSASMNYIINKDTKGKKLILNGVEYDLIKE